MDWTYILKSASLMPDFSWIPFRWQPLGHLLRAAVFTYSSWILVNIKCPTAEGSGNPFQCSCLENPMDRGAWWATVRTALHGVITENGHKAAALVVPRAFFFPCKFLAIFYWSRVDFCCVCFRCAGTWFSYTQMFAPFRAQLYTDVCSL